MLQILHGVNSTFLCFFIGAGINVFNGLPPIDSQPNNSLVRPIDTTSTDPEARRLRFFCRSDSTVRNVGELIGHGGTAITTNDVFEINTDRVNGGELEVVNFVGSNDVTSNEQGVYTCRIPLQSGEMSEINIGIYPNAFNCEFIVTVNSKVFTWDSSWFTGSTLPWVVRVVMKSPVYRLGCVLSQFLPAAVPTITNPLVFTQGSPSSTLTCTSTTSIATTVIFMRDGNAINGIVRDGDSVTVSGVAYQLSQTVTNRSQSTYDNVLTITEALSSLAGSIFACQVENTLGPSQTSQSFQILGKTRGLSIYY